MKVSEPTGLQSIWSQWLVGVSVVELDWQLVWRLVRENAHLTQNILCDCGPLLQDASGQGRHDLLHL